MRTYPAFVQSLSLSGALAITIILAGCGTTRHTGGTTEGDTLDEQLKRVEADFRPSELDPDPAVRHTGTGLDGTPQTADTAGSPQANLEQDQGFRVQLYSTPSIDEAKQKKAEAEAIFPGEWFYMEYDAPTYKIRAGNFLTRFAADRFARQLIEKGFPDSWAVPSRVFKNPGVRP